MIFLLRKRPHFWILFPLLLLVGCHAHYFDRPNSYNSNEIALVIEGQSEWRISLRPNATKQEILAAHELSKYIDKISGAKLAIVYEIKPTRHIIQIECTKGELDGFDLTVAEDRISIRGHTPRGALYGAYQLLEDMGCRWYYIGNLGEVIPTVVDIKLTSHKTIQRASFRERSVMIAYPSYYQRFDEWIDYFAKSRINNVVIYGQSLEWWKAHRNRYLPLLQERQMILEFGGHILPSFVPRELFGQHPEDFRMNKAGERTNDHNFCVNSDAIEILKTNSRDYIAQLPEITYFHMWADDLTDGGWCHCPKCKTLSPADQNLIAQNTVASVMAQVNPKASLALLAYHDTGKVSNLRPAPNLFLFHAPRERCYAHPFNDSACRRNHEEYMEPWLELRTIFQKTAPSTIHEFNYYTDGLLNREMQPPQVETIPADARYFRDMKLPVIQNLMVCFRDWHSPPVSLVLFARAAWNADVNGWETLEDFCRHYYGQKLVGSMMDYYRGVEEACQLVFNGDPISGPYIDMTWPPLDPKMIKPKIAEVNTARAIHLGLFEQLDGVLKTAPDGIIKERLRRERDVFELHQLILDLACNHFEGQFRAYQYMAGAVDRNEGKRAADMLTNAVGLVEKIGVWITHFPKEQNGLIHGWQAYWNGYVKPFSELEKQVQQKLLTENEGSLNKGTHE